MASEKEIMDKADRIIKNHSDAISAYTDVIVAAKRLTEYDYHALFLESCLYNAANIVKNCKMLETIVDKAPSSMKECLVDFEFFKDLSYKYNKVFVRCNDGNRYNIIGFSVTSFYDEHENVATLIINIMSKGEMDWLCRNRCIDVYFDTKEIKHYDTNNGIGCDIDQDFEYGNDYYKYGEYRYSYWSFINSGVGQRYKESEDKDAAMDMFLLRCYDDALRIADMEERG